MGQPLPFAQGFYVSESRPISSQECINMYPNIPQTGTVTRQSLFQTPGIIEIANAGVNEFNRGVHVFNGIPYAVNGNNLYRIDRTIDAFGNASYNAVQVNGGVPLPGQERVIMSDNGTGGGQICIIIPELNTQFNGYIYTELGGLVQISDVDFDGPVNGLVYVDGFFLFTKTDGNKFFISQLRDGLSYIATDFADAEVDPDPIRAPFVLRNEVLIFGSETFEPFQNVGGAGFPFTRIEGAVQDKGISSNNSIIELDGNIAWVGSADGEQPAIWLSNGGKPQKISTTAIDNQLRLYSDTTIANAFAMRYSQSGALFGIWTFPNERTYVYDAVTQLWHTRESTINEGQQPWRVSDIREAYGEFIVGDLRSNLFGILSRETYREFDQIIKRRFILPPIDNGGEPFFNDSVEMVMETGTSNTVDPGQNAKVLMFYSDNGGRSFGQSIPRNIGLTGEFEQRVIWDQLGVAQRSRMYGFEFAEDAKYSIYKIEANVS